MSATNLRRYRVEHQTAYRYEEPVTLSHHQLRLTPRPLPHQCSQAHELALTPAPAYRYERSDAFGNPVTELAPAGAPILRFSKPRGLFSNRPMRG